MLKWLRNLMRPSVSVTVTNMAPDDLELSIVRDGAVMRIVASRRARPPASRLTAAAPDLLFRRIARRELSAEPTDDKSGSRARGSGHPGRAEFFDALLKNGSSSGSSSWQESGSATPRRVHRLPATQVYAPRQPRLPRNAPVSGVLAALATVYVSARIARWFAR